MVGVVEPLVVGESWVVVVVGGMVDVFVFVGGMCSVVHGVVWLEGVLMYCVVYGGLYG